MGCGGIAPRQQSATPRQGVLGVLPRPVVLDSSQYVSGRFTSSPLRRRPKFTNNPKISGRSRQDAACGRPKSDFHRLFDPPRTDKKIIRFKMDPKRFPKSTKNVPKTHPKDHRTKRTLSCPQAPLNPNPPWPYRPKEK